MFDRYAAATAPSWGRRALAIASIALHVGAGIALAIYSLMHIEEITPPAVSLTFFSAPPPPPPPPAGHKAHTTKPKTPKPTIIPTTVPKLVQPKEEEKPEPEDDDNDDPAGVEGGVKGGVAGGVVGGVVGSNGAPTASPKMVPMFTLLASRISTNLPHLPDTFMSAHGHSKVGATYKICLDTAGSVSSVAVIRSIQPGVDEQVMSQIKSGWKYKPQPLPVCFAQPFTFVIN